MSDNTLQPANPVLFFISRLFILIGMVLVFTFGFMGIGLFVSRYLFGIDALTNPGLLSDYESNPAVLQTHKLVQGLSTIGGFLLPAMLFPRAIQQWPSVFIRSGSFASPLSYLIALGIMLVSMPLVAQLIQWNEAITFPAAWSDLEQQLMAAQQNAERMTRAFVSGNGNVALFTNLILVALLPAICEEFLFRGALMRFVQFCFHKKHLAVWITAAVFSMVHGEFYGFIPRFVLGLFLGYIALYTNSIWPAVAAHFLNNGLALMILHFHWDESVYFLSEAYTFPAWLTAVSTVIAFFLWLVLYRIDRNKHAFNGE